MPPEQGTGAILGLYACAASARTSRRDITTSLTTPSNHKNKGVKYIRDLRACYNLGGGKKPAPNGHQQSRKFSGVGRCHLYPHPLSIPEPIAAYPDLLTDRAQANDKLLNQNIRARERVQWSSANPLLTSLALSPVRLFSGLL